jgi:hypothetical protein
MIFFYQLRVCRLKTPFSPIATFFFIRIDIMYESLMTPRKALTMSMSYISEMLLACTLGFPTPTPFSYKQQINSQMEQHSTDVSKIYNMKKNGCLQQQYGVAHENTP